MNKRRKYDKDRRVVLFIVDRIFYGTGGTEKQVLRILDGLRNRGVEAKLLLLMETPWLKQVNRCPDQTIPVIPIYKFRKLTTYWNVIRLISLVSSSNPDIVHTFMPISNVVGVIAAKIARVENIISSRRDYGEWMSPWYLLLTRLANNFVTSIVTNSYAVKRLTESKEGVPSSKIQVIYNGFDVGELREKIRQTSENVREELGIPDSAKVVGTIANLRPMKRLDTLFYAAREIARLRSDVVFIIVGTGPEEAKLKSLAKILGIRNITYFVGRQLDVAKYLKTFDVAVNSSEKEGLSNAIMEYLAAGIPVVASEAGGNVELIKDNINGFTFKVGEHKELANKILILLENQELRERFKRTSRSLLGKLDLDTMIDNYERFYRSLIERD